MGRLVYRLDNPAYTIYHRAALGGLASTVRAWSKEGDGEELADKGIHGQYDEMSVTLEWGDAMEGTEALRQVLQASFRVTENKLIDLPGHGIPSNRHAERVAVHNAILGTFLQHHTTRSVNKDIAFINIANADQEDRPPILISYKPVNNFAHQSAKGMELLDKKGGSLPKTAKIPQYVVPGAMSGSVSLEAPGDEAFLLLYLIVGCPLYLVRSDSWKEKVQFGILVPDVSNLKQFVRRVHRDHDQATMIERSDLFGYDNRIVGGAEEAAVHFLVGRTVGDRIDKDFMGVRGFQTVAMGKVAWDGNQNNRSSMRAIRLHYDEIDIYRAAAGSRLNEKRKIPLKTGDTFVKPATRFPALIAANLAADRHWCDGLKEWIGEQSEFRQLKYMREGLVRMKNAIRNEQDKAIVEAFHEGLRRMYGQKGDRARKEGTSFARLTEVELERIRNTILRMKTMESLFGWFVQFCSTGSGGKGIAAFGKHRELLLSFFNEPRNHARLQNLCLFAMLSYEGADKNELPEAQNSIGGVR
ncbi:MAG TPA: type I-MYXAN CRISPR-associated Cas8a1/Cmx1 [Paenibacillus sp.]|uniref:type I-MYXAN CRISPR-associated Cas8a1/Cmx1 n=1 Tax=Paenibacillus sp. TaxID=58172 RepID=UPI002CEABEB3|nr:type I-MYXAN CRISPR-associated Cas8a1/Cmx1 [Paenibacillus sp.]HUC93259.1 type I-MYXAN CRISPR-associated Cas8a1/Cmx1 [Paenibacillus sp.]